MELKDLSSNWKKLQATLQGDTSKPLKRKASDHALQPHSNGARRVRTKLDSTPRVEKGGRLNTKKSKPRNMGLESSKESAQSTKSSASLALWAQDNDISAKDLAQAYGTSIKSISLPSLSDTALDNAKINDGLSSTAEAGKYIAIDCEMVGVGPDPEKESALARVSIVNYHGHQLYDSFVLPKEPVTDYRTFVSGITPQLRRSARTLETVQADVVQLLDGRILIGHAIRKDLDMLLLGHPKRDIRDTSRYPPFRRYAAGRTPGLKKLAKEILGVDIQGGEHSSVEDARATMLLYRKEKEGFEADHAKKWAPTRKLLQGANSQNGNSNKKKKKIKM